MSDDTIELKDKGLKELIKAFKNGIPVVKVGILGGSNARKDENSNATIGAEHEFGTTTKPMRSFLRMPLSTELAPAIERSRIFTPQVLKEVIRTSRIIPWAQKLAIIAEGVVQEAFNTGGFGKWKPSDMRNKKNKQTLVETQQLRDSITSEVK